MRMFIFSILLGLLTIAIYLIVEKWEVAFMLILYWIGHTGGWDYRGWYDALIRRRSKPYERRKT